MIPRRPSNLFRSRRAALLWAAGVLLTAVATVGFGPVPGGNATDATGLVVENADLQALKAVIEGTR